MFCGQRQIGSGFFEGNDEWVDRNEGHGNFNPELMVNGHCLRTEYWDIVKDYRVSLILH